MMKFFFSLSLVFFLRVTNQLRLVQRMWISYKHQCQVYWKIFPMLMFFIVFTMFLVVLMFSCIFTFSTGWIRRMKWKKQSSTMEFEFQFQCEKAHQIHILIFPSTYNTTLRERENKWGENVNEELHNFLI